MALCRINLLGDVEVMPRSGKPIAIPCRKAAALLGYLALNSHCAVARRRLGTLLWEDRLEEQSRASLRQALMLLRRTIPESDAVIAADRDAIRLLNDAVETDIEELEQLLENSDPVGLTRAAALYRGDLLDGVGYVSTGFEAWLTAERQKVKSLAITAMTTLMSGATTRKWVDSGIALALRILAIDPLEESVHQALIRCYLRQGRRGDALRQYRRCRTALWQEVRAVPEGETERLHRDICRQRR